MSSGVCGESIIGYWLCSCLEVDAQAIKRLTERLDGRWYSKDCIHTMECCTQYCYTIDEGRTEDDETRERDFFKNGLQDTQNLNKEMRRRVKSRLLANKDNRQPRINRNRYFATACSRV